MTARLSREAGTGRIRSYVSCIYSRNSYGSLAIYRLIGLALSARSIVPTNVPQSITHEKASSAQRQIREYQADECQPDGDTTEPSRNAVDGLLAVATFESSPLDNA